MKPTLVEEHLRGTGLMPMVRAAHSQAEIDLLPPYGDPEVSIPGEIGTYLAVGTAVALIDRFANRR